MEKAAEVYTRLKSRVLGPKMESIQKANKAGPEKDKGEAEKGQEKLSGAETRNEKGEEETNAGNTPEHPCTSWDRSLPCPGMSQSPPWGMACPAGDTGHGEVASVVEGSAPPAVLCWSARSGKGLDVGCSEGRGQTSSPTPGLWGPPRWFLAQDGSSLPA